METYHPDRILIEPSGVGKLSDVIEAAKAGLGDEGMLNSFTAVCDVNKAKMYLKNFGEFYRDQVASAHTVILSRTQSATEAKLGETVALIKEINPGAVIITTPWDELGGETMLRAMEENNTMAERLMQEAKEAHHHHHHDHDGECHHEHHHHHECDDPDCECHHGHHHADDVFMSWGVETARKYTEDELCAALHALSEITDGMVLRAKGVVAGDAGWYHFDMTPGESQIRKGGADYTGRICVIGTGLDTHMLAHLFHTEA